MNNKIIVEVDLSNLELPAFEETIDDIMETTGKTKEQICKDLKLDPTVVDDNDIKSTPVTKKELTKFKTDLMDRIKEDIKELIEMYESDEFDEPSLGTSIDEVGGDLYNVDDLELSWDISNQVKIKVK